VSWAKIDDLLPHHRKLVEAGAAAPAVFGLYVASICYAQRHLTNGHISRSVLSLLLPGSPRPRAQLIAKLVKLRLWDVKDDGWVVHDYLDHNDDAKTIITRRRAETARKARWRHSGTDAGRDAGQTAGLRAESRGSSSPLPSDSAELSSSPTEADRPDGVSPLRLGNPEDGRTGLGRAGEEPALREIMRRRAEILRERRERGSLS
jgi:hypothetical protein